MKKLYLFLPLALILCFLFGCQDKAAMAELEKYKAQAMVEEQNKALMLRAVEDWNRGSNEFFIENTVPDYAYYSPSGNSKPMSREGTDENITALWKGFPDLRFTIEEVVAEGDKLTTRFSFTGTHLGEFMGIPATGNKIEVTGLIISLIKKGKFVEDREEIDTLGMMMQLGMELRPIEAKKNNLGDIVKEHFKAINNHDVEKDLTFFTDDVVFELDDDTKLSGKDQLRKLMESDAVNKARLTITDIRVEGSTVIVKETEKNEGYRLLRIEELNTISIYKFRGRLIEKIKLESAPESERLYNEKYKPFAEWASKEHPQKFSKMETGGYTAENARRYLSLLKEWSDKTQK